MKAVVLLTLASASLVRASAIFSFTQLDVPGAHSTQANGINNAGQIRRDFRRQRGQDRRLPLHRRERHAIRRAVGTLQDVLGINNAGLIVGSVDVPVGYHEDQYHGFVATPLLTSIPEPAKFEEGLRLTAIETTIAI